MAKFQTKNTLKLYIEILYRKIKSFKLLFDHAIYMLYIKARIMTLMRQKGYNGMKLHNASSVVYAK